MDEADLKKQPAFEIGMALDTLSIDELEANIGRLEGEIERLRAAIGSKNNAQTAADSYFTR